MQVTWVRVLIWKIPPGEEQLGPCTPTTAPVLQSLGVATTEPVYCNYCSLRALEPVLHNKSVYVLVAQLCPTLCDPMNCSPPGSSVHGILQARILEWVASPFSRGIFLTQGLNPGLLNCRQILYNLSHQESPLFFYPLAIWSFALEFWEFFIF